MSHVPYLKCGKLTFQLQDGDTVMDNGSCLQLVTREIQKGFYTTIPRVSKSEFRRFKSYSQVSKDANNSYGSGVELWKITLPNALTQ